MKRKIYWLIQSNQVTPIIYEYFLVLQARLKPVLDLNFIVPETDRELLQKIEKLKPTPFKINSRSAIHSKEAYFLKKSHLDPGSFAEGLSFSDVLLLDDLGGGDVQQTTFELKRNPEDCGILAQIPTPFGTSEIEERVFHAAVLFANQNQIPFAGYELLPLDTRWTLAPSLSDAVITKSHDSCTYLKKEFPGKHIWMLPRVEAALFSPLATMFDLNGVKAGYHYKNVHRIPYNRTVLAIPHNVAMVYEYQEMIRMISGLGDRLHLMFLTGKDQARGSHSHQQIIETVYHRELKSFASYSFHDINSHWEICMADAVAACSACFHTMVAEEKNIPAIIFEPGMPPENSGIKRRIATQKALVQEISDTISFHLETTEFSDILIQMTQTKDRNG